MSTEDQTINYSLAWCATRSLETAVYRRQGETPEWYRWLTKLNGTTVRGDINIGSAHSPISNHGHVFGRDGGTAQGHANRSDLSLTLEGTTKTNKGTKERGCATEFSSHKVFRVRNNIVIIHLLLCNQISLILQTHLLALTFNAYE